ncbi:MAG TPA: hypothetical protein VHB25_19235 [Gemmatimonadaceae bacterium]|nr:hypothetical protein [Gemmatimonadaceae bacterium]
MKERFGVHVDRERVRAVLVRHGAMVWHDEVRLASDESIGEAVAGLLGRAPARRAHSRIAGIALGGSASRTRQLAGLPPLGSEQAVRALVRQNASAFFVHCWREVAVGAVERRSDGSCWATVYDAPLASEIAAAVRGRIVTAVAVTSAVVAVARLLPPGEHRCCVDSVPYRITTIDRGMIVALAPVVAPGPDREPPSLAVPHALPDGASEFAIAYGAALLATDRALAWRSPEHDVRVHRRRRSGIAAAASFSALAFCWAYAAPGIHAEWLLRHDSSVATASHAPEVDAARTASELQRTSLQLSEVARFQASRGAVQALLGDLTRSLPESTAIVSLHIDSLSGTIMVLTPHVPDVLPQLVPLRRIVAPRLVGSITRESAANAQMERASIRFERPRSVDAGSRRRDPRARSPH